MSSRSLLLLLLLFSLLSVAADIFALISLDFVWSFCRRVEIARLAMAGVSYAAGILLRVLYREKSLVKICAVLMSLGTFTLLVFYAICCGLHFHRYRKIDRDCARGNFTLIEKYENKFTWDDEIDFARSEEGQMKRAFCHSNYQYDYFEYNNRVYYISTKKKPTEEGFECFKEKIERIPKMPENTIKLLSDYNEAILSECIGKRGCGLYMCSKEKSEAQKNYRRLNNIIKGGCLLNRHWNISLIFYILIGFFWFIVTFFWVLVIFSLEEKTEINEGEKKEHEKNNMEKIVKIRESINEGNGGKIEGNTNDKINIETPGGNNKEKNVSYWDDPLTIGDETI